MAAGILATRMAHRHHGHGPNLVEYYGSIPWPGAGGYVNRVRIYVHHEFTKLWSGLGSLFGVSLVSVTANAPCAPGRPAWRRTLDKGGTRGFEGCASPQRRIVRSTLGLDVAPPVIVALRAHVLMLKRVQWG